jgi:hypothetical protein
MNKIDLAVQSYLQTAQAYREAKQNFSSVELAKIAVANAFLEMMAIDAHPVSEQFMPEGRTTPLKQGFVYLMRNKRNGFVKIGWSINPEFREKTLQSEEPEITLIWKSDGTRAAEAALHFKFAAKRLRGEWFELSDADVEVIQSNFAEVEK